MGEPPAEDPMSASKNRVPMHLQCVGSFRAHTQAGHQYTVEIWTHFGAVHDRNISRVAPSQLVLTTTEGRGVDRLAQGRYRLTDDPEVGLLSDDPNAP